MMSMPMRTEMAPEQKLGSGVTGGFLPVRGGEPSVKISGKFNIWGGHKIVFERLVWTVKH